MLFFFIQLKVRDLRQNVREVQDNETYKQQKKTTPTTKLFLDNKIRNHWTNPKKPSSNIVKRLKWKFLTTNNINKS